VREQAEDPVDAATVTAETADCEEAETISTGPDDCECMGCSEYAVQQVGCALNLQWIGGSG
jgi:hypothetical protein